MDRVLSAVNCGECRKILVWPVILQCNHSVCREHLQNAKKFTCSRCGVQSKTANLPVNEALSEIIAARVPAIDFGPTHRQSKERCDELEGRIKEMDLLLKDPYAYTCAEINKMRAQVRSKSQQLKQVIDRETSRLLTNLDQYQEECRTSLSNSNMSSTQREKFKVARNRSSNSLGSWKQQLNEIKFDEKKWSEITYECEEAIRELNKCIKSFKKELLLNEIENQNKSDVEHFQRVELKSRREVKGGVTNPEKPPKGDIW